LKSHHMFTFLDIAERVETIKKKISDADKAQGNPPLSANLPDPGAPKELSRSVSTASTAASAAPKTSAKPTDDEETKEIEKIAPLSVAEVCIYETFLYLYIFIFDMIE
jgi:hypothetical protein